VIKDKKLEKLKGQSLLWFGHTMGMKTLK